MNIVVLMGRLTRDPEVRYSQAETPMAIARYTIAVDRRGKKDGDNTDFIRCVAFGKSAEFAEKYLHKGSKITVNGRIQTGSYEDQNGNRVYTTEVVIENQEFAESKAASESNVKASAPAATSAANIPMQESEEGFMVVPDNIEELLGF